MQRILQVTTQLLALLILLSPPYHGIEISTLFPDRTENIEAAIEYTSSFQTVRDNIHETLNTNYNKHPNKFNLLIKSSYYLIDLLLLSTGSAITIHEIGHTNAYTYLGANSYYLGTGSNSNATLLELYFLSALNGNAFSGYSNLADTSSTAYTLIAGAGTNATYTYKNKLLRQGIQKNSLTQAEFNDYTSTQLHTLYNLFEDDEHQINNDFNDYIDSMNAQGYAISIDNLRSQYLWSTILSHQIYLKAPYRSPFTTYNIGNLMFYAPEFTPFLMPTAVTEHIELYFKTSQLFSIAYEFPTIGNKERTEITYGWYPTYKNLKFSIRVSLNDKNDLFVSIINHYILNKKLALVTKLFSGNTETYAQTRQSLTSTSQLSIGLHFAP